MHPLIHMPAIAGVFVFGAALAQEPVPGADPDAKPGYGLFRNLQRDLDHFTLVSDRGGLSFHKPMFLLPWTYSDDIPGRDIEVLFQISLKQEIWDRFLFFGYTQRSFWQLYDSDQSRPFRETNYNPELFFRWKPRWTSRPELGFDLGGDHESNGKDLPDSRSWNRLFAGVYWENEKSLAYLKTWYRLPEDEKTSPEDTEGDDNPDIEKYYGYGELHLQRKLFGAQRKHMAHLMLRGNPASGKGTVNLTYSAPFGPYSFWELYLWHGYGEGLIDYDTKVTRVGVGLMLAR